MSCQTRCGWCLQGPSEENGNRSHVSYIDIPFGTLASFFVLLIGKSHKTPRYASRPNFSNRQVYRPIVMIHTSLHVASKMIPPGVASLEPPLVSNPCCSNSYPLELHSNMQCGIKTLELRTKISYIHKANQRWYSDLRTSLSFHNMIFSALIHR